MKTFKKSLILCIAICAFCANWTAFALDKGVLFMQEIEIWKDIPDYEGLYQISSLSNVKSVERKTSKNSLYIKERILKHILGMNGYYAVALHKSWPAPAKRKYVHRLFATAFIPNPLNLPCINHINGIKTDNRPENLEWCTKEDNVKHAFKAGLMGVRGPNRKQNMLEEDVIKIKKLLNSGVRVYIVAKMFNTSHSRINSIKIGDSWKHLQLKE